MVIVPVAPVPVGEISMTSVTAQTAMPSKDVVAAVATLLADPPVANRIRTPAIVPVIADVPRT